MKRWKKKRNVRLHKNTHHIFPQSTFPELKNEKWNQVKIDERIHNLYHQLFSNMSPQEIIDFLTQYFWGGHLEVRRIENGK